MMMKRAEKVKEVYKIIKKELEQNYRFNIREYAEKMEYENYILHVAMRRIIKERIA